jgi:hypothetical protein
MASFSSESWVGPASLHCSEKVQRLLDFKKDESECNVRMWIDEYVAQLQKEIQSARIREEREDF